MLSIPIIFNNSDNYAEFRSWLAVGSYEFEYTQTVDALEVIVVYICLFVLIALIFDKLLLKPYREIKWLSSVIILILFRFI